MTLSKTLSTLLLLGGVSYASSLAVYQDRTFYTFEPKGEFIGFGQGLSAKCDGDTIALSRTSSCPEGERLCKELETFKSTEQVVNAVHENIKTLDQLITLPQPTVFDASSWIEAARLLGEEKSMLSHKKEKLQKEYERQREAFQKQAPIQEGVQTSQTCDKALELTIPYGYVSFSTNYEANIVDDKEVTVTQNLSITNRSGVDIESDTAMFYYRSARQYVNPIHFNPWIVSKYVPRPKRTYSGKAMMQKEAPVDMAMMAEERIAPISAPVVSYEDAREYKIQNLTLPSTGVPLDVEVLSWKAPLSCEIRAYPYANAKAFHVCSFKPQYQIDSNRWKVKAGKDIINENAVGEYRKGKYDLYTKIEDDIQIQRRPIVQKERETGIFGGTARKKDGFTITVTNKSDKKKSLRLIERIPTSTTEEIKSKLLSVKSEKTIDYKMLKDGKIEMQIALGSNEIKKIEVLFEISYDKDLKVNY